MKIHPLGAALTEGRTDGHYEDIRRFPLRM